MPSQVRNVSESRWPALDAGWGAGRGRSLLCALSITPKHLDSGAPETSRPVVRSAPCAEIVPARPVPQRQHTWGLADRCVMRSGVGVGDAGLLQDALQGGGAAGALEVTLAGLDRGLWAAGGPAGTLLAAVGIQPDDVVHCPQVRRIRRTSTLEAEAEADVQSCCTVAATLPPELSRGGLLPMHRLALAATSALSVPRMSRFPQISCSCLTSFWSESRKSHGCGTAVRALVDGGAVQLLVSHCACRHSGGWARPGDRSRVRASRRRPQLPPGACLRVISSSQYAHARSIATSDGYESWGAAHFFPRP